MCVCVCVWGGELPDVSCGIYIWMVGVCVCVCVYVGSGILFQSPSHAVFVLNSVIQSQILLSILHG